MTEPATPSARALPPWWTVLVVAIAIAGVAFAIGRFSTFGPTAAAAPGTQSAEAGFARDMQVHHGQAVEMAMDIYRTTDNPDVRVLAYDIATTQSAQKGEFYDWLVTWGLPQAGGPLMAWMDAADTAHHHGGSATSGARPSDAELMTQMGMASAAELAEMRAQTGTTADCTFLQLMIRHHRGALPMAQALLQLGHDPRALAVAQGVIDTQSAEIDLMTSLRSQLGCTG
ncbi:DUF305 domain-containing protein [Microbacterium sp. VKM Ac-2870]|uniref:DUF305 domain-containing protein n=1 Tax=Microbacterium sp. VKM Ac-2870 TaxID=2783825 RepID=UPI00188D17AF|nr:DUF305 domain-containing protein [Microbacterium sp. VKM Ac-2870]MBF4563047.1 DUF305 domain-containing protein [Microbacterium sp. VKM Ac-2870]